MRPLFFLILLYPLLELWLLVKVGSAIGAAAVLAVVLGSGLCGLAILRRAGWLTLLRARTGAAPVVAITDGFLLAGAGLLLFLPGLLGDGVGVLLLLPATRRRLSRRLWKPFAGSRGQAGRHPEVIEGDFRREDQRDDQHPS
ncbi:MAG: FxsA family protein [Spongiibacteraceae bacterium]